MSQFGVQIHRKSVRKHSGNGKIKIKARDKQRNEIGGYFAATKLGEKDAISVERGRGGSAKNRLRYASNANVLTKQGYKKAKIKSIVESPDNRNFARLNIITKGTIIDTELGKAVVTNRPGREGSINAKLI